MQNDIKDLLKYSKEFEILYVEDDPELQKSMLKIFNRLFHKVDTADNGEIGLEKYNIRLNTDKPYDLVLTDINMPKMNGIEMSQEILNQMAEQKIIIISAYSEAHYLQQAIDIGVSGFLTKPIKNTQLFRQLVPVCSALYNKKRYESYVEQIEEQNTILREQVHNKRLETLQEEFLRNISHEIKTPLNALSSISSILKNVIDTKDKKVTKYLDIVEESSQKIETLINKILHLSKLRSGTYKIIKEDHVLKPLLEKMIELYTDEANKHEITFNYQIDSSLDMSVECDLVVVKTIVGELLDNAIKFNQKGGRIGLRVAYEKNNKALKIEIKDNGIGIDSSEHDKVYDMFYQVDGSLTRAKEGAGLGLSLVKHMTELKGGSVDFESTKDEGTFFYVVLPTE